MTGKSSATVIIDSREPEDVILKTSKHPEVDEWYVSELEAGDLLINDSLLVERKTPQDMASSILEDRIRSQAEKMMNSGYPHSFILLEGDMGDFENLEHTKIKPQSLRGAMASISIRYGTPVVPVGNLDNLIDYAVRLGRKAVESPSTSIIKSGNAPSSDVPTTVKMLTNIDGISEVVAYNLYSRYGSIESVLQASVEDMQDVPNIGKKRAETVYEALRGGNGKSSNQSWTN